METTPKQSAVCFNFNAHNDTPQIPRMQDVLFSLLLSDRDEFYRVSRNNSDLRYLSNVAMVVEAVGGRVKELWASDDAEARRIVARSIVDLCPEEAKCLFREAFITAKRLAGDNVPGLKANADELMYACECSYCRDSIRDRALSTD